MSDAILNKGDYLRKSGLDALITFIKQNCVAKAGDTMTGPLVLKDIQAVEGGEIVITIDSTTYHINKSGIYADTVIGSEANVDLGTPENKFDHVYVKHLHVANAEDIHIGDKTLSELLDDLANADEIWEELNKKADKTYVDGKLQEIEDSINGEGGVVNDLEQKIEAEKTARENADTELDGKITSSKAAIDAIIETIKEDLAKCVLRAGDTMEGQLRLNNIGIVGSDLVISTNVADYVINENAIYSRPARGQGSDLGMDSAWWENGYIKSLNTKGMHVPSADLIEFEDSNLQQELDKKVSNETFNNYMQSNSADVDGKIAAAKQEVKHDILGDVDGAYDTLKEIQDFLQGHDTALAELLQNLSLYVLKSDYETFISNTNNTINQFKGEVNSKVEQVEQSFENYKSDIQTNLDDLERNKVNRIGDDSISGSLTIGKKLSAQDVEALNGKYSEVEAYNGVKTNKVDFGDGVVLSKEEGNVVSSGNIIPQRSSQTLGDSIHRWYKISTLYFETQDGKLAVLPDNAAPFTVNGNVNLVDNLNADMLDGKHYEDLQNEFYGYVDTVQSNLKNIIDDFKAEQKYIIDDHTKRLDALEAIFRWEHFDELDKKVDSVQQSLDELTGRVDNVESRLDENDQNMFDLESKITAEKNRAEAEEKRLEELIGSSNSELQQELEQKIDETKKEVEKEIGDAKTELQQNIDNQRQELEQEIADDKKEFDEFKSTVEKDYATKEDVAQAKSEAISDANEYTDEEIKKVRQSLNELEENVSNIVEEQLVEVNNRIDKVEGDLRMTKIELQQNIDIVSGKVTSLQQNFSEYKEEVNNMFTNADSNVDSKIQAAKDELNQTIEDTKTNLEAADKAIKDELEEHIRNAQEELGDKFDNLETEIDSKIQAAKDELNSTITENKESLESKIKESETNLKGEIEKEAQARQTADAELEGKITAEKTRAEGAEQGLSDRIDALESKVENDIESAIEDLQGDINDAKSELEGKIDEEAQTRASKDAELEGKIDSNKSEIDERLDEIESHLGDVSDKVAEDFVKKADFDEWKAGELKNSLNTTESNSNKYTDAEVKKVNDKFADYCTHTECHASLEAAKSELKQYTDTKFNDADKNISNVASDLEKFKENTTNEFKNYYTKELSDSKYASQTEFSDLKADVKLKVDATYVVQQLADKVSITQLNQTLGDYAKVTDVNVKLSEKADKTDLEALRQRLATEESTRQAADEAMKSDFSNQLTSLNNTLSAALTQHDKDIAVEKEARQAADNVEKEARIEGDNRLSSDITSEAGTRKDEDDKLRAMIEKCPTTDTVNQLIQIEIQKIVGVGDSWTTLIELSKWFEQNGDKFEELTELINDKVSKSDFDAALAKKADITYVDQELKNKADKSDLVQEVADRKGEISRLEMLINNLQGNVNNNMVSQNEFNEFKTNLNEKLAGLASKGDIPQRTSQLTNDGDGVNGEGRFVGINGDITGNSATTTMATDSQRLGGVIAANYAQVNQPNNWSAYQDFQAGAGNSGSDMRYKEEVTPMNNVLDDVMKLDLIDYKWVKEGEPVQDTFGVSAQQLQELGGDFAKMVNPDIQGTRRVAYDRFGIVAMKAIQELYTVVLRQQAEIAKLNTLIKQ